MPGYRNYEEGKSIVKMVFQIFAKVDSGVNGNKDWEHILQEIGSRLYESGMVKDGFTKALIKREKEFPTGLQLPFNISIALAHADPKWIIHTGMVVYFMLKPVGFRKMDNRKSVIPCHVVIIPLIINPSDYMQFLSGQIKYVTTKEFAELVANRYFDRVVDTIGSLATNLLRDSFLKVTWWTNGAGSQVKNIIQGSE